MKATKAILIGNKYFNDALSKSKFYLINQAPREWIEFSMRVVVVNIVYLL